MRDKKPRRILTKGEYVRTRRGCGDDAGSNPRRGMEVKPTYVVVGNYRSIER